MAQAADRSPKRRATRKRLLYAEITRWGLPGLAGLHDDEIDYLQQLGFGPWLARARVTDTMIVALIDDALIYLEAISEDHVPHQAAERRQMIAVLLAMTATSHRDDPDAAAVLTALMQLDDLVAAWGLEEYKVGLDGKVTPVSEPHEIATMWQALQASYPALITRLRNQISNQRLSTRKLELGGGNTIILGEQPHHRQLLERLRGELGDRYVAPDSTLAYRRARVRKWRQLAAARRAN